MNRLLTVKCIDFYVFKYIMNRLLITDFVNKKDINTGVFDVENCCKTFDNF